MVDWTKLFFAVCVFALHSYIGADWAHYDVFCALALRLAVPYFFVASGFFLAQSVYGKGRGMAAIYGKHGFLARVARMIVFFEPISLLAFAVKEYRRGTAIGEIARDSVQSILFYPKGALWYLQALIVAVILLTPLIRRGKEERAVPAGIALYFVAALCNRYHFVIAGTRAAEWVQAYRSVFVTARNGLFVGVFYVAAGMALAKSCARFKGKERLLRWLLIPAYLVYIAEVFAVRGLPAVDDGSLYLSHLFLGPLLFLVTAQWPPFFPTKARLARSLSTTVYLLHRPILSWLEIAWAALFHIGLSHEQAFLAAAVVMAAICAPLYQWRRPRWFYDLVR